MPETNQISGNGSGNGAPDKFQVTLPSQSGSTDEVEKKSAFSFLQNLLKKEKPDATSSPAAATQTSPIAVAAASPSAAQVLPSTVQAPAVPAAPSSIKPQEGNVYSKLFGKSDMSQTGKKADTNGGSKSPLQKILGAKPFLARAPTLDEFAERRKVIRAKRFFFFVATIAILFVAFVSVQLNPEFELFGKTIAKKFEETNQSVVAVQTETNEARLRLVLFHVNRLNLHGDSFLFYQNILSSAQSTASEKTFARAKLAGQQKEIERSLEAIKDAFSKPFIITTSVNQDVSRIDLEKQFEDALKASLQSKQSALDPQKPEDREELRTIGNIIQLLDNRAFRGFLKNINLSGLDEKGTADIIQRIRERGSDELSAIAQLKQKRIPWTEIMSRIDEVTRKVDKVYGQGLFEELGGVRYTNYDFNTKTGQISLTGQVKTDDAKTFTLLADIVDAFEKSLYFKDVDYRDFSKSKSEQFGYSSGLRLQFTLQGAHEKDPRDSTLVTL